MSTTSRSIHTLLYLRGNGISDLRLKEKRRISWLNFRHPRSIAILHSFFYFNENKFYPLDVAGIQIKECSFPLKLFNVVKLIFIVTINKKKKSFIFFIDSNDASPLRTKFKKHIQLELSSVINSCKKEIEIINAEKVSLYNTLAYVRYSQADRFSTKFISVFKQQLNLINSYAKHEMLTSSQSNEFDTIHQSLLRLEPFIADWNNARDSHNKSFIKYFKESECEYFDTVESSPLTDEQVVAALVFEDANLVVAAAGSGKSSCIVGKIGFAIKAGLFRDDEILALAYNKKAAKGLQDRLNTKLEKSLGRKINVASKTFHGFGLSILTQALNGNTKLEVLKEDDGKEEKRFIKTVITKLYDTDEVFQSALADWLLKAAYEDPQLVGESDNLEECARLYEECCRDRIKAKKDPNRKSFQPTIPTYDPKVYVRSLQERCIANWLLLHGVTFDYEKPDWDAAKRLKIPDSSNGKRPPYTPDFTYQVNKSTLKKSVSSIRIVHEHFALDAHGNAPKWMGGKIYSDQAKQKREMYEAWTKETNLAKDKVRFFETRSADFYDGTIFDKLQRFLEAEGIEIGSQNKQIESQALSSFRNSSELEVLIIDFVLNFKESGLSKGKVLHEASLSLNPYRAKLFLRVAFCVFDAYQASLISANKIDYADMLRQSESLIKSGQVKVPYKLILVDEFQDIAKLKADLVKSTLNQDPENSVVFCVGDDWQTINRFAGSDVRIFIGIDKYFERHVERIDLSKTFRCAQGIANVSRNLVMLNEGQFDKNVLSHNPRVESTVRIVEHGKNGSDRQEALNAELEKIIMSSQSVPTVQILRKTQHEVTSPEGVDTKYLNELKLKYSGKLDIEILSVHGSKGLEADFVIILGLESGFKGFPDERSTEWLLDLVLPKLNDLVEEDRRLFYVGLTRARHQAIVLTAAERPSEFILELALQNGSNGAIEWIKHSEERTSCPLCQKGSLISGNTKSSKRVCSRGRVCGYQEK